MKTRSGFVSNSSSSSFVISKDALAPWQKEAIRTHYEDPGCDPEWAWDISETADTICGYTFMDNFNMREYLKGKLLIPDRDIQWRD
jgi:hypothetical protein